MQLTESDLDDSLLVKCIARARTFEETVIRALRAIAGPGFFQMFFAEL